VLTDFCGVSTMRIGLEKRRVNGRHHGRLQIRADR
jgi:hypothetical protein